MESILSCDISPLFKRVWRIEMGSFHPVFHIRDPIAQIIIEKWSTMFSPTNVWSPTK